MQIRYMSLLIFLALGAFPSYAEMKTPAAEADGAWRSGWINFKDEAELKSYIECAKELGFHALIAHGYDKARFRVFTELTAAAGIESYWWFTPAGPQGKDAKACGQKLRPDEESAWKKLMADKQKMEKGYQGGGEPLPGHVEYNYYGTACFHHQDVIEATKVAIKAVLDEYPKLSGIALDMFGYPNYRDCVCDESERQLAAYRKQHPDQSEVVARETFSRDTLVEFQNEICRYARQLRPDIKSTVHVWPTYLPEPVYGNRLDLDYCCQTAAWFMLPYWSDEKVTQHARHIVEDARQYHRRQTGVPFVGLFVGKPGCDKSAERFEHELRTIFTATASRSLSVYDFANIAKRPTYKAAVKRVWSDCGVKVSDKRNTLR